MVSTNCVYTTIAYDPHFSLRDLITAELRCPLCLADEAEAAEQAPVVAEPLQEQQG